MSQQLEGLLGDKQKGNKARLRMEQIEIAAHLLAPLGNKNTIKMEPCMFNHASGRVQSFRVSVTAAEEMKLSYDSELEEGEIDERMLFLKQEAHTESTHCVVERFILPAGVSYHDKPVRMDATASALATKMKPTTHTATGAKRRAEELEEGLIMVKKERLED
ncbi:hypothetical protein FRC12_012037 [Ceratobasidium sp. 428]|nr:hypothetical protein FRC12_012037 [Ceratobasidium sp. 428]